MGRSGRYGLELGAPRCFDRHDGRRGRAYADAWRALYREFIGDPAQHLQRFPKVKGRRSEPPTLLQRDMQGCALAMVESAEATRDLETARRQAFGGRGHGRADVRHLEARARRAARQYQATRELLERSRRPR